MAKSEDLRILSETDPIPYDSKKIVYFVFDNNKEPEILTTRYVSEKMQIVNWFKKAVNNKSIRIVAIWPGQYRSEALLCDPIIALKKLTL